MASNRSDDAVLGKIEAKSEQKQTVRQTCEQCEQEKPVKAFCVECQDYLCEECSIHHCRPRIMRHHRLLKESDMPRKKSTKLVSENCDKHADEVNKFYCERHDECCCAVCVATLHKSCEVKALSSITKNYLTSEEYVNSKKDLKLIDDSARKQIETIEKKIESSKKSVNVALEELNNQRNDINKHFEKLEKELKNEAMKIHTEDTEQMHDLSTSCRTVLKNIEEMNDALSVLEDTQQEKLLFTAVKTNKKQLEHMKDSLKQINNTTKVRLVEFCKSRATNAMTIRKDLLGYLKTYMGEDEDAERPEEVKEVEKEDNKGKKEEGKGEKDVAGKLKEKIQKGGKTEEKGGKEGINKKEKEEENEEENGGGKRDDFKNVSANQNKSLCNNCEHLRTHFDCQYCPTVALPKVLNMSETAAVVVLDFHKRKVSLYTRKDATEYANIIFSTGPWDAAEVQTNLLAVTLPHEKKIKLLSLENGIAEADEIPTPGFCRSVAPVRDFLVVTFSEPAGLKLLSKSGVVLRNIPMIQDGRILFKAPSSVVAADGDIFFVADPFTNTVTQMNSDGKIENTVRLKDVSKKLSFISYSKKKLLVSFSNSLQFLSMTCDLKNIKTENNDLDMFLGSANATDLHYASFQITHICNCDEEDEKPNALRKTSNKQCNVS